MHEVGAHQTSKSKRAFRDGLGRLRQPQEHKDGQCDGDLNAYGIFGDADKALDPQGLVDPAEEQFDLPALLVEVGDLGGWSIQIVGHDAQDRAQCR